MASSLSITEAELLDALASAARGDAPEEARTTQELADEAGVPARKVNAALRALHRQGRLVSHRVIRVGVDGRLAPVPAYTILPVKKGKRAA